MTVLMIGGTGAQGIPVVKGELAEFDILLY
jgi:hypothetical protein